MNNRIVKAIGACTRTLTGIADAEALLARAHAPTIGGLRAVGDRLAARRLFHDPVVHQRYLPQDASGAFDALEQARLDALAANWLPGIARNLIAYPGADDDGLRWLAFESWSGHAAPPVKHPLLSGVRAALPSPLLSGLQNLSANLRRQELFARAAAAWLREAAGHLPRASSPPSPHAADALAMRYADRYERKGRYAAATTARRAADTPADEAAGAGSSPERRLEGPQPGVSYRVFTTAHDRVVNASALASREELDRLRQALDEELGSMRPIVARLAKKLLRVLLARQVREWRFDLDEGLLDASRLAPMIASRGAARPFRQETDSPFPSTAVTLLIDHSGSMRGRPMRIAALTVEIFVRVLERCGVKCEVLGFTTRDWDGGDPGREWAAAGYREAPGRLNALEHIIIKSADTPWRRARAGLGLFMRDGMLKENIDGEALLWAHRRLLTRGEHRRVLVVVSDGTPMDEATLAANGYDYLDRHLQAVIHDIETRSAVQLAAIGIGHDVSQFYTNATRIARIDDLGPALTAKLVALLGRE